MPPPFLKKNPVEALHKEYEKELLEIVRGTNVRLSKKVIF
jgi:primosomal protein N''